MSTFFKTIVISLNLCYNGVVIESIKATTSYKSLKLNTNFVHAYFFYSSDKELNNNVAMLFAKNLMCEHGTGCNNCHNCQMFNVSTHPDMVIIDKPSIKVEDALTLVNKATTKPIISRKKVFVILNAENMNEIAQNKLLKSLEEPNLDNIFILTATKTDKILPTILSRVSKMFVPKLNKADKLLIKDDLLKDGININNYIDQDISLTDIIYFESSDEYKNTLNSVCQLLKNLNSSADIPNVVSFIGNVNKPLFFSIMQELFLASLKKDSSKFNNTILTHISALYSEKAIIKCIPLIENAYTKLMSNVNFNYILDNLLFNILKERFLCK